MKGAIAVAAALVLTACADRSEEAGAAATDAEPQQVRQIWEIIPPPKLKSYAPINFHHRDRWNETYRLPMTEVRIKGYVLRAVHIGSSDAFDQFEAVGHRGEAPFTLEFDRAETAKPVIYPEDTARPPDLIVRPTAYHLGWSRNSSPYGGATYDFVGEHPDLGEVRFEAEEVIAPPGGRRFNIFEPGGMKLVVLVAVIAANGEAQNVNLGLLDWYPCPDQKSRELSMECVRS